jgi:hypothetical protein
VETLVWGWNTMPKAIIFEKMMELALPIVKHYRSDFYHDAMYLNNLEDRPTVFYYAIRETGTSIFDAPYMLNGHATFRITIENNDGDWSFGAERI